MAGFAFLEYDTLKDAEQAVNDFNNKDFLGERILVEFAKPPRSMMDDRFGGGPPRGAPYGGGYGGGGYGGAPGGPGGYGPPRGFDRPPRQPGHRLTISGLPGGTSWQEIKDFGRSVGAVGFADVDRRDPTIGYIEFGSRYDAEEAVRKLDGAELNGVQVQVKDESGGSGGRDRDEGYSRPSTRDRYDDRERRRSPSPRRRSPSPRRSRSPAPRRRSPTPERERERERSPVREREREPTRSRSPRGYRD